MEQLSHSEAGERINELAGKVWDLRSDILQIAGSFQDPASRTLGRQYMDFQDAGVHFARHLGHYLLTHDQRTAEAVASNG